MSTDIAKAVGHIPSGLFIVSAKTGDQLDGYLASWVQQISFEPLLVAFTIKPDRPGYETITSGKPFAINIVGDHETQYLRHFWSGYDPADSPFNKIEHTITDEGAVLIKDAKSSIICKFKEKTTPGDHELIIAEVIGSEVHSEEAKPKVHIRKSGLDY